MSALKLLRRSGLATLVLSVALSSSALASHPPGSIGLDFRVADAETSTGEPVEVYSNPDGDAFWAGVCDLDDPSTSESGFGVLPSGPILDCIDHGTAYHVSTQNPNPPRETTWQPGLHPQWRLDTATQAGSHPDGTVSFWLKRSPFSPVDHGSTHSVSSDGDTKDVVVKLPPGFVGNPNAVPQCPSELLRTSPPGCPPETQVGVATVTLGEGAGAAPTDQRVPVFNVEPRDGKLAEFLLSVKANAVASVNIPVVASARTDGDFGIDTMAINLPGGLPLLGQTITIWGVPWAASHDAYRAPAYYLRNGTNDNGGQQGIPKDGLPDPTGNQPQPYQPSWGPVRAFFWGQTECDPTSRPLTVLEMDAWQYPGAWKQASAPLDAPVDGCGDVPFEPDIELTPTASAADAPTGLTADLEIPQLLDAPIPAPAPGAPQSEVDDYLTQVNDFWKTDPASLSTSQLKDAVVTLPPGVAVNPAGAAGLAGCSDSQIGLTAASTPTSAATFTKDDPFDGRGAECPEGSKIGHVEVYSPLVPLADGEQPGDPNLSGDVVLGMPKKVDHDGNPATPPQLDPESGQMFRLFIVLRNEKRGFVGKLAGSAVADEDTGQLTTTFQQSPRVPFETMKLQLKGGQRSQLAMPQRCGPTSWSSLLTPWTAAHGAGGVSVPDGGSFNPNANCGFGFAPSLRAGMDNPSAGGSGVFTLKFTRPEGQQWVKSLTAKLPAGLLAKVGAVDLCTNAQLAAFAALQRTVPAPAGEPCPIGSKVGIVDAGAGSGTPFFLQKKGSVYLTEGYKGAPYGLATVVPVETPPFTGEFALPTVVVRQALHVDRNDATATAVSDPLPQILKGVPLRVREVTVLMNRPGFMRNPTSCATKQIAATFESANGARSSASQAFKASGCRSLPFRPKLSLRLTGKKQVVSGKHPGVEASVTQRPGEAAIKRVEVRLPTALVLDESNARALCEFVDGTKPDPENHCPAGSIVGRATAVSPLLKRPLTGNVFFVKNVRIDPVTGNPRRTLPMLVVALRGEIAVNLRGKSAVKGPRLVSIFDQVPDAPISRFDMEITGGKNGILLVTETARRKLNICGPQTALADMDGQNGKRYDRDIRVKTPCKKLKKKVSCKTKKQRRSKACKRRAKRSADRR